LALSGIVRIIYSTVDDGKIRAGKFFDGKILFGEMLSLWNTRGDRILTKIFLKDLVAVIGSCNTLAMINWTIMRNTTKIAQFRLQTSIRNGQKDAGYFVI
jgi:hypothetical protein